MRKILQRRSAGTARPPGLWVVMAALAVLMAASSPAWANVYASELVKTGDLSFSYILNQDAGTNVQIQVWSLDDQLIYTEDLGPQTKGTHTWSWDGDAGHPNNEYKVKIVASDPGYTGWHKISSDSNPALCCWVPQGVTVNKNQNSANFGKIYIGNGQAGADHLHTPASTYTGIYRVHADGTADAFGTGGIAFDSAIHPLYVTVGPDNHLYMADVNVDISYEFSDDLSSTTQLNDSSNLSNYGKTNAQWVRSIVVEGTQAEGNRKIYLCDSNYNDTSHKGLVRYTLGAAAAVPANNKGTQYIGPAHYTYFPTDVARDANGDWYLNNYRATAGQASPLEKFQDSTTLPINNTAWQASSSYVYSRSVDTCEKTNQACFCRWNNGYVYTYNKDTGTYLGYFDSGSYADDVSYDAAGNVYVGDEVTELTTIWSPAGANDFTTDAYFNLYVPGTPHTLTLNASPEGWGTTAGGGTHYAEETITAEALEVVGYKLEKWTDVGGATVSTDNPYIFEMPDNDLTLTAVFVPTTERRLTLVSVPDGAAATLTGGGMHEPGSSVAVSTTPNSPWAFVAWTSDPEGYNVVSTNPSFNYTMPSGPVTLYAQVPETSILCPWSPAQAERHPAIRPAARSWHLHP